MFLCKFNNVLIILDNTSYVLVILDNMTSYVLVILYTITSYVLVILDNITSYVLAILLPCCFKFSLMFYTHSWFLFIKISFFVFLVVLLSFYTPQKISEEHIVAGLSVRPTVSLYVPNSCPAHNFVACSQIFKLFHRNDHHIETTCPVQKKNWVATLKIKVTAWPYSKIMSGP